MSAFKALTVGSILFTTAAFAQEPAADAPADDASVMKLGNIDVRGMIDTDIFLIAPQIGVMAELGLVPAGPGTLAVGAEIDYGFCGSACWLVSGLTAIDIGESYFTPMVRASYHFAIPALKKADKLDLFASLGVGLTFAGAHVTADDGSFGARASSTGLAIAPGVGVNYFANEHFFLGGELRYRIASGEYTFTFTEGSTNTTYQFSDDEQYWNNSGLGVNLFLGWRI